MPEKDRDDAEGSGDRPARLIDVARRAKVSRATAARALGGYGPVGAATREKVQIAARELNYSANVLARAMRAGTTKTIGVVVADISNSFFSSAVRAIIDTATAAGYQTLVINTDDNIQREIEAVRVLLEKRVDGLIVVPSSINIYDHLMLEGELAKPVVLLDRRLMGLDVACAYTDDRAGAKAAVELFLESGHKHIGLLLATAAANGPKVVQPAGAVATVVDRQDGAMEALHMAQAPCPAIRYSRSNVDESTAAAKELLAMNPRPTAILATNEEMALGVVSACMELGLAVGCDISLISFDDSPWTRVFSPAISVIRRPVHDLGNAAVSALIQEIQGGGRSGKIVLPTTLIDRASVARLT
ncbi:MAG: LacI family DNA-binding transcriptional regulator [Pseudorhodobacter sp.]